MPGLPCKPRFFVQRRIFGQKKKNNGNQRFTDQQNTVIQVITQRLVCIGSQSWSCFHMDVSLNGGTQQPWFSYQTWSFWGVSGVPPFKETPIYWLLHRKELLLCCKGTCQKYHLISEKPFRRPWQSTMAFGHIQVHSMKDVTLLVPGVSRYLKET